MFRTMEHQSGFDYDVTLDGGQGGGGQDPPLLDTDITIHDLTIYMVAAAR